MELICINMNLSMCKSEAITTNLIFFFRGSYFYSDFRYFSFFETDFCYRLFVPKIQLNPNILKRYREFYLIRFYGFWYKIKIKSAKIYISFYPNLNQLTPVFINNSSILNIFLLWVVIFPPIREKDLGEWALVPGCLISGPDFLKQDRKLKTCGKYP